MSEIYLGSKKHIEYCKQNLKKGREVLKEKKKERIEHYMLNPNHCNNCSKCLFYDDKNKKYCNSSCAASFNNKIRIVSNRTFSKIGMENIIKSCKTRKISPSTQCKIHFRICKGCEKLFVVSWLKGNLERKTCSKDCSVIASVTKRSYINGRKNYSKYFNKWIEKNVTLESSWEIKVAEFLDEKEIYWERPKPIKWVDSKQKSRLYFPDFYLNNYDVYLDPKNLYCMSKDVEKLGIVEKQIHLEYGALEKILKFIKEIQ